MRQSHEENSRSPIDPGVWNELCGLLARVCDDDLNESDRLRLTQILDADSAARRYYLEYIAVHSASTTAAGCRPSMHKWLSSE